MNFSLYVDDRNIETVTATESLAAWFQVDAFPGLDMGEARCRVKTELQEMMSEPVSLEVGETWCDGCLPSIRRRPRICVL